VEDGRTGECAEFYDLRRDPHELRNLIDQPIAQQDALRAWLLAKYQALLRDRRGDGGGSAVDPRHPEDLKALGHL
jgi:hypothetical protein